MIRQSYESHVISSMTLEHISVEYLHGLMGSYEVRAHLLKLQPNITKTCHPCGDVPKAFSFIRRLLEKFHATNDLPEERKVQAYLILIWLGRISQNELSLRFYLDKGSIRFMTSVIKFMMLCLHKTLSGNFEFISGDRLHCLTNLLEDSVMVCALLNSDTTFAECKPKHYVLSQIGLLISIINNEMKINDSSIPWAPKLHSSIHILIETFRYQSWRCGSTPRNEEITRIHASYLLEQTFLFILSCHHIKFGDFSLFCDSILGCVASVSSNIRLDRILEMVFHEL